MLQVAQRRSLLPCLVLLLSLFVSSIASSQPRERDVWDSIVDDGQRFGYIHTVVTKLPDGNFLYNIETRTLVEFLGAKQEMTSRAEYVVTGEYRLVLAKMVGQLTSGPVRMDGKVTNGKLTLSTETAGLEQNRTVDLPDDAIFGVCLDDWMRDLPQDTQTVRVNMINEQSFGLVQNTLTCNQRNASGSEWSFRFEAQLGRGSRSYDADGNLREVVHDLPKMHMQRSAAEQARDIDYVTMGGRDVLMFPIDKDITNPDRLTGLSVKLSWKDVTFEELDLEDSRQSIMEKSDQDGNRRALVAIKAPDLTGCDALFPVTGGNHDLALAETFFIKPHDKSIVDTARRIVKGKKTALEAVEALSNFVYEHIEPTVIFETLSGPEVLKSRTGKCAEFSILFASLARSVGIPTRIVLGVRMVGGIWGGHGWNEAFVGRWITVDPNLNEVGTSFALLKFVHSDTLMGTQTVRWTLGKSLDISIVDFDVRPSPLANKYTTGIDGHIFTSVEFACRVTAPDENWSLTDTSEPGNVAVRFKTPDNTALEAFFVGIPVPAGTKLKAIVAPRLDLIRGKLPDVQIEEEEACDVNGAKGLRRRYRGTVTVNGQKVTMLLSEITLVHGSFGYYFQLPSTEAAHENCLEDFRKLVNGFECLCADCAADSSVMSDDGGPSTSTQPSKSTQAADSVHGAMQDSVRRDSQDESKTDPATSQAQEEELPKAEQILDTYVQVTGGKAAYDKLENRIDEATIEIVGSGMTFSLTAYHARPDKTYFLIEGEAIGKIEKGTNGGVAWEASARSGPSIKSGVERDHMLRQGLFDQSIQWRKLFKKADCVGVEPIEGKPCYKVVLTQETGEPETRFYDKKTNLLSKTVATEWTGVSYELFFSNYMEVDGVRSPHKVRRITMGQETLFTIDSIRRNVAMPADRFELPDDVQALLDKKGADPLQNNIESFDRVWSIVNEQYWDPKFGGLDWQAVRDELRPRMVKASTMPEARAILRDMISRLKLSHFAIIPPDNRNDTKQPKNVGAPGGETGIDARVIDGKALVTSVAKGSSAERVGVRPGWEIIRINEFDVVANLKKLDRELPDTPSKRVKLTAEMVIRVRSGVGETTAVTFRNGEGKTVNLTIPFGSPRGRSAKVGNFGHARVRIDVKTVGDNIGYIAINKFLDPAYVMKTFNDAMESFMEADGIILDLRGNGGGKDAMALGMMGWLAPKEWVAGRLRTRGNEFKMIVRPRVRTYAGPVAVLTDGLTGSSAEFVAAALQEMGRACGIGTRTKGEALPAEYTTLPNGDVFLYAVADFVTGAGERLEGVGVAPDIEVALTQGSLLEGRDIVLEAAVDWIRTQK